MSTFIKIGNSILDNSRKKRKINILRSKSVFSETVKPYRLKKSSSMSSFQNSNTKYNSIKNNHKNSFLRYKNNSTNFNFYNNSTKNNNNYNKFKNTAIGFHLFNKKDYINEANKIIHQRLEDKNHDLLGFKSKTKSSIISNTKEISLNNFLIEEIKKNINNMTIKQDNIKKSLIKSGNEFEEDYKTFLSYIEYRKHKLKKENDDYLKYKEMHEETKENYHKELQLFKKLSEELEKKIKKICSLKNYGCFVYKILGIHFWLSDIPELDQKNKNFEEILELILQKYDFLVSNNNFFDDQNDILDDTFLIIKFKEFENKFINAMKSKDNFFRELDLENNNDENNLNINILKKNLNLLKIKEKNLLIERNKLMKSIDNIMNKKQKGEDINIYLEYIIQLGKETEKLNINENNYFENNLPKEYIKRVKEYDFNYYTINTMNDLKKKERLINKFIEYIENIEKSEDKKIITEIELERKNKNKKEKLKNLKLKMNKMHEDRNRRAIERNAKFVIISRQVPELFQFNKDKKLKNKKNEKNKNDIDLLFFHEDDEN